MTDLNIQRQLDKHFLICSSSLEVAKAFNKITRLEKIDKSVSLLTTDINLNNKNIKGLSEQIQNLQAKIDEIGNLKEMGEEIEQIESDNIKVKQEKTNIQSLEEDIISIESIEQKLTKYKNLPKALEVFNQIEEASSEIKNAQAEVESLCSIIERIDELANNISNIDKWLKDALIDYESLQAQSISIQDENEKIKRIEDSLTSINRANEIGEKYKKDLNNCVSKYKEFLKTIKICPFCDVCKTPLEEHDFNLFLKGIQL
jgi:DNA repair exonuclease SbcCD ATPase subunit